MWQLRPILITVCLESGFSPSLTPRARVIFPCQAASVRLWFSGVPSVIAALSNWNLWGESLCEYLNLLLMRCKKQSYFWVTIPQLLLLLTLPKNRELFQWTSTLRETPLYTQNIGKTLWALLKSRKRKLSKITHG